MKVVFACDFKHTNPIECPLWKDQLEEFPPHATAPFFVEGKEYDLPEDLADYFIRGGVAAKPGEEVVKPDPGKPVFVQPQNVKMGNKSTGA